MALSKTSEISSTAQDLQGWQPSRKVLTRVRLWSSLLKNRLALGGSAVLVLVLLMAVFAPMLATQDPNLVVLSRKLLPPAWSGGTMAYPLGTDSLGRDIYTRIVWGSRVSLTVAVSVVLISGTIGVSAGLVSGYFRGRLDDVIMRLADIQLAFPSMLLYLGVMAVLGSGLLNVILLLGVSRWVVYARVVRGETMSLREKEFVAAARSLGAPDFWIMLKHILPNVLAPVIVISSFSVATTIITEASLSFLGVGVPMEIPTWGGMLNEGREVIRLAWWPVSLPGIAIMLTVLGINAVGDWLRDFFDPRLKEG